MSLLFTSALRSQRNVLHYAKKVMFSLLSVCLSVCLSVTKKTTDQNYGIVRRNPGTID